MNSKALVYAALRGEAHARPVCGPLAVHYCARHARVSVRDYTLNANCLAESILAYYETFHPDAVWVSSDTWITAEAMGATVGFTDEDGPMGGDGTQAICSLDDLASLPAPDPMCQGRQPLMLDALRQVKRAIGEEAFIVACFDQSPFSLACAMGGLQEVMMASVTDPSFVEALLAKCADYAVAYGQALAENGADMLSTGDSPVIMLGEERYQQMALPYEQRVFQQLHDTTECLLSLHVCGDATSLLPHMAQSGADVLELDHHVDMAAACAALPHEIAIWGNLDPVSVLYHGTPDGVTAACEQLLHTVETTQRNRFVLSSGCTLAPDTPAANVHALIHAATRR